MQNESMDAFDDFGAELCPLPESKVQHFDLEINRNNFIGNKKKEIDGLRYILSDSLNLLTAGIVSQ